MFKVESRRIVVSMQGAIIIRVNDGMYVYFRIALFCKDSDRSFRKVCKWINVLL